MTQPGDEDLQVIIPADLRKERADKMLARLHPELSRSRWQKLFQRGRVWSEDRVLMQKDKLRPGDLVQFSIPPVEPLALQPVKMDLDVLLEDEHVLVINKEPGRIVHPGAGTGEDTLVHGLLYHCQGMLTGIGGTERPGIVHRLDKETSGVIIVAKSEIAFQSLSGQFAERVVEKDYKALVCGLPDPPAGIVEEPIGRHPVHRTRMACRKDGRHARTDYTVGMAFGNAASLVDLQILTGRTHQIRVHLQKIGHPILGDTLYGYKPARMEQAVTAAAIPVPRVMLHAALLQFVHPASGKKVLVEAPLPPDFRKVMEALNTAISGPESH